MSWSMRYGSLANFDADQPDSTMGMPSREVIDKAREVALVLIKTKIVGDRLDYDFTFSFSGHENPGHIPKKGYANDMVTISITQQIKDKP